MSPHSSGAVQKPAEVAGADTAPLTTCFPGRDHFNRFGCGDTAVSHSLTASQLLTEQLIHARSWGLSNE